MAKLPAPSIPENVPFDQDGNLIRYPVYAKDIHWKSNSVFKERLTLDSKLYHAASSKYVIWRDKHGHHYPMFAPDLLRLCLEGCVLSGSAIGPWTFTKRGTAYGLVHIRGAMVQPRTAGRLPDATKELDVQD